MSSHIPPTPGAFTIHEFCKAFGFSHSQFYILDKEGKAPRSYFVGARRYVSYEAAREWQRQLEQVA